MLPKPTAAPAALKYNEKLEDHRTGEPPDARTSVGFRIAKKIPLLAVTELRCKSGVRQLFGWRTSVRVTNFGTGSSTRAVLTTNDRDRWPVAQALEAVRSAHAHVFGTQTLDRPTPAFDHHWDQNAPKAWVLQFRQRSPNHE
jgi:hypothetical protein